MNGMFHPAGIVQENGVDQIPATVHGLRTSLSNRFGPAVSGGPAGQRVTVRVDHGVLHLLGARPGSSALRPFGLAVGVLVGLTRDTRGDPTLAQVSTVGLGGVRLVGQHRVRPGSRPTAAGPGDTYFRECGKELGAVAASPGGHHRGHQLAALFAGQMSLGGPPAPGNGRGRDLLAQPAYHRAVPSEVHRLRSRDRPVRDVLRLGIAHGGFSYVD